MSDRKQDLKGAHGLGSSEKPRDASGTDPLADTSGFISQEVPAGVDRRLFLIRSAVGGAAAVMMGRTVSGEERSAMAVATMPPQATGSAPPLSADLGCREEVERTGADDRRRVLQGGARAVQLAHDWSDAHHLRFLSAMHQAAGRQARHGRRSSQVNLFGSLSATGARDTARNAPRWQGLVGKEPATVDPKFLDGLRDNPDQVFPVKLGDKSINVSLKDVIYDATKGDFKHPNTMTCKLLAGNAVFARAGVLTRSAADSSSGKEYAAPKKNPPKYLVATMKELRGMPSTTRQRSRRSCWPGNEMSDRGPQRSEVYAFADKIVNAMVATVKSGLSMPEDDVLPGPIKLHSKAATVYKRAMDDKYEADRGIGTLSAFALAASEENGRGHLVITAPTGGSAGVMPALVYGSSRSARSIRSRSARGCRLLRRSPLPASIMRRCLRPRVGPPGRRDRRGVVHGRGIGRDGVRRGIARRRERGRIVRAPPG